MKPGRTSALVGLAVVAGAALVAVPTPAVADPRIQGSVHSVPEPGSDTPVEIFYTLYRPEQASAEHPVPLIFHGHGWAGSRTDDPDAFGRWLESGFGVLSFDQRGFGSSGGKAHVQHPDLEGQDVRALVKEVAALDWVAQDGPGDPRLGAIGGSYGGGYQFNGAFTALRDGGSPLFDALAPEITWWDLKESLAPSEVVRTAWVTLLYAASVLDIPPELHQAFVFGAATGEWPKGQAGVTPDLDAFFARNGPSHHVAEGRRLDIPVLLGQGMTDNLFNVNQAVKIFEQALTPEARERSLLVGYNGGHAAPELVPFGPPVAGDPCSEAIAGGSFSDLTLEFFDHVLKGGPAPWPDDQPLYNLATQTNTCVSTDSITDRVDVMVGDVVTTSGLGLPLHYELAEGPLTVAGVPLLDGVVTATGPDNRVFLGLSVGRTPVDARLVQANVMPLRIAGPVTGRAVTAVELPGVGVEVGAGERLYLTVSPLATMFFGHGARTPGAVIVKAASVRLPVVR